MTVVCVLVIIFAINRSLCLVAGPGGKDPCPILPKPKGIDLLDIILVETNMVGNCLPFCNLFF